MAGAMPGNHDAPLSGTWLPDPSHYPEQMTPLSATVWFTAIGHGLHEAMRQIHGPFGGFNAHTELGWAYEHELEPDWEGDPDGLEKAARQLGRQWETRIRPRVHAITAELERMRPECPPPEEAVAMFDRMWELVREQWTLHFLTVIPSQIAIEMLTDRYRELIGDDPLGPYRLLDGLATERTEADTWLWRLAQRAIELGVDDVLREWPPDAAIDRLRELRLGRVWLGELAAYLQRFGGRVRWHEVSLPREAERPQMTLESIRLFLERDQPPASHARERALLQGETLARTPELRDTLEIAKTGYALKEDHAYHIDYPGLLATREVLLGFGRRVLAEGGIVALDDIWMLRRDELRNALAQPDLSPLMAIVERRREELRRGRMEGVRPYLGEPPPAAQRHAALEHFYGTAAQQTGGPTMRGITASTGRAEGPARVVTGPDDFRRVQPGDILIATTTTPAWTPLFPSLAALVTETGGVLCHAAVVAREYGIPAVVGVNGVTRLIPDGARLRVDAGAGTVEMLGGG